MPTPKAGYKLADGSKVPGVTTVIGQLGWNKGALMYWAWDQGRQGKDFRDTKDSAADLGTLVHTLIEAEMKGGKSDVTTVPLEMRDKVENALLGFYEWRDAFHVVATGSEVQLVSERYRFGGTIDYPVLVNGRRCVLDLKTAKDIYPDTWIQVAAYGLLWNETHPDDLVTGYHILKVGKEDGGFSHHYQASLSDHLEAFYALLSLYELKRRIEK